MKLNGQWIKVAADDMPWFEKKRMALKWWWHGLMRHVKQAKSLKKGVKRWWKLRKLMRESNKAMLERVRIEKAHDAYYRQSRGESYLYPPPTVEELAEFVKAAQNAGIRFDNMVQPMPKTPKKSKVDVDIRDMEP